MADGPRVLGRSANSAPETRTALAEHLRQVGAVLTEAVENYPQIPHLGRRGDVGVEDPQTDRLLDPPTRQEDGLRFLCCQG